MGKLLRDIPLEKLYVGMPFEIKVTYGIGAGSNYLSFGNEQEGLSHLATKWAKGKLAYISPILCQDGSQRFLFEVMHPDAKNQNFPEGVILVTVLDLKAINDIRVDSSRL
ncbi:MAG TPA: hypothetical protein VMX17_14450 [Candidatus Glassbacteria bacterium]|nr:hypothetical protein [Candidatus Glassbacteria bacterium]